MVAKEVAQLDVWRPEPSALPEILSAKRVYIKRLRLWDEPWLISWWNEDNGRDDRGRQGMDSFH